MSASVIRYRKLVTTDVARQAVNLAESGTMGHRVQIPMSVDDMNAFFVWDRPAGSDRAVGHFKAEGNSVSFDDALSYALSRTFTDVDGVTNGLNFSSAILDANTDSRIRKNGSVMANDIVMAYVIYKCYGSSSAPTEGVVYNLQDAHDMLSNGALVSAIHASLSQEEAVSNTPGMDKGAVDAMFRDLLAADPSRFFDSAGKQVTGLFETSVDTNSRGSWGFVQNDKIEIAVQMKFLNPVTRRGVDSAEEETETVVIAAGSVFKIRLQIVATDTPSGAAAKEEVAKTEMAMSIAEQAAMTAKAAANAASAQRMAAQAMAAAAAQTTAAQERFTKAVDTNKKQSTAAAKAVAAAKAAQAALQLAIATGKTQTEIQAQRAAAVAAAALAENLQAIADIAATELQTAKNLADAASATLAAAQTQAATAQATVVSANAAAAKAAAMKAEQQAADLAAAKAAADAASDPFTKKIVDAEKAVLDPQALVTLDAKFNDAKIKRLSASVTADKAYSGVLESARKYDTARANLEYALSAGKKPEDIQIFKAATVSALSAKERAELNAQNTLSNLTSYYNLELGALQMADKAKLHAATLASSVAASGVNQATRKVNMATTAYTYASTMTADALASATDAQTTLDARISGGAVFTEIQTRRKAVLDANAVLAEVKVKSDAAAAALEDAKKELVAANAAAAAAVANISVVGANRTTAETFYQSTITATKAYFTQRMEGADDTEKSLKAAALVAALNTARNMLSQANAALMVAKRNVDVAISSGKRLSQVSALREISQGAQVKQERAQLVLQKAQSTFNEYASSLKESVSSIMGAAAEFQEGQAEAVKINSLASIYNNAFINYADVKAEFDAAKAQDELVKSRLDNALTNGTSLPEITVLRQMKLKSSSDYAAAMAKYKSAVSALVMANPRTGGVSYISTMGSSGGGGGGGGSSSGGGSLQTISTITGTPGLSGFTDGNMSQGGAVFFSPTDIVFASNGDMYVADANNHCIRKVTPAGIVTTLAGNPGVMGYADGTGTNAKFHYPYSLDLGPDGNIYVADVNNYTIRKVTPSGVVTTLVGIATAVFTNPSGITVVSNGDIYVSDNASGDIYKVTPSGVVTTFASGFYEPYDLTSDPNGNIYVVNTFSHSISKITPAGVATIFVGSSSNTNGYADGTGTDARFNLPKGVEFGPDGNLYVTDTTNHAIRKVTPAGVVTTVAGGSLNTTSGTRDYGYADGTGTNAKFYNPNAVAFSPNGDMYVADQGNNLIRKVTGSGVVTTFVGVPGTYGHADGDGTINSRPALSQIDFVFAPNGDIYVADQLGNTIRRVSPSGVVTTIAGKPGQSGSADGTGTNAMFNGPLSMALGPDGNLYVADINSNAIRKVTPSGVVTTVTAMYSPTGLAFGPDGNMYVTTQEHVIRKVTLAGVVTEFVGSQAGNLDGTGTNAQFQLPSQLAFGPDGNLYVADTHNYCIRKVTLAGVVTTLAGGPIDPANGYNVSGHLDGTGRNAQFYYPYGITVASNGDIYVTDNGHKYIRKVTPSGVVTTIIESVYQPNYIHVYSDTIYYSVPGAIQKIISSGSFSTIATTNYTSTMTITQTTALVAGIGQGGFTDGSAREGALFNTPKQIKFASNGDMYVTDYGNTCIRKVTPSGIVSVFVGIPGVGGNDPGRFNGVGGMAIASNGDMYVSDIRNNTIRKVSPSGVVTEFVGIPNPGGYVDETGADARFMRPESLEIGPDGNIYVADEGNNCIRKITPSGVVTTFVGNQGAAGYADGTGTNASFMIPYSLTFGPDGNMYVVDLGNQCIRKVTPSGVVTTIAGNPGVGGLADGTGTDALFSSPSGITFGPDGNMYVSDTVNNCIRKVTPSGVVTTLAGGALDQNGAILVYANGTGTNAGFNGPTGLAFGSDGSLYVVDSGNQVIRKVTLAGVVSRFVGIPGQSGYSDGDGTIDTVRATFDMISNFIFASNGDMYVADQFNHSIRKVTPSGVVTTFAGSGIQGYTDGTGTNAQFGAPTGLAFGPDGNIYVADQANQLIRKVTPSGVVSTFVGRPGVNGLVDGTGTDAQFWNPVSISFGPDGNMYVADNANTCIRKVTPAGVVTTLAGTNASGYLDGTGTNALFTQPYAMALGPDGSLYVTDSSNFVIRKVTPSGVVTTLAGNPGVSGYADGTGTNAQFAEIYSITIAPNGDIYTADSGNQLIRKITTAGVVTTVSETLTGIITVNIHSNTLYWGTNFTLNTVALTNNLMTTSTITTSISTIGSDGSSPPTTSTITTYGPSLENPLVSSILGAAIALRESETLAAKNSEYVLQAQKAYTDLTAINIKYEKLVSEKDAIANKLKTALEGGKTLAEVLDLQKELAAKTEEITNAQFYKTAITSTYQSASAKATPTQAVLTTLDTTKNNMISAGVQKKIDTASKDMSKAFVAFNAAKTEEAAAQGKYDVLNEELNTAIAQGADTAVLLRKLNFAGSQLVEKKSATLRADKGYKAALQTYNDLYTTQSIALPATFAMQGAEISTIMSTVTATTALSISSINAAKNNTLTRNLSQTYSQMMQLSTIVQQDQAAYDNITADFNAAIDQGKTLAEIQALRAKLQDASKQIVTNKSDLINKRTAYTNSLLVAVESPGAKSILDALAQTQTQITEGAKANALLNTLIEAKQLVFALNAEDAAAQSELLTANSAMQIATAGASVPKEKYEAVLAAISKAAAIRNKLLNANKAVMNAQVNVQMNPNVEAINAIATTRYIQQNAKAESNTLIAQYNEAKANEAATYAALSVAKKTLETAAAAFDSAISSGTDLQAIQAARDAMNAAASQVNAANQAQASASASLNTAIANSKMSPVANALVVTQRVNDENVVAGTKVTTEQYKLNLLNAELAKAQTAATAAAAAATTANANLQASLSTATPQEMEELRSLATSTAQASTAAQTALGNKNTSVLEQKAVVQTATAAFQATQNAVAANNIATFLLFNGFVFQQAADRYALNPSLLPATVRPGISIPLDSITIMPLDLGTYSATAEYTLGSVVSYPDINGARYTCLVSSQDPRGASYTSIVNKDPAAFPTLWVQKEGPSLRYNATTDLLISNASIQGSSLTVDIASGELQGMQTLFTNSDINGNNTLLHGLTMFGPDVSSTLTSPANVTLTGYTNNRTTLTITASKSLSATTYGDLPLGLTATGQGGAIIHSPNSVTLTVINTVDSTQYFDVENNNISFSFKPELMASTVDDAGFTLADNTLGSAHGFFLKKQNNGDSTFSIVTASATIGWNLSPTFTTYTAGQTLRVSFTRTEVKYYLDSTLLDTTPNYAKNVRLQLNNNTSAPLRFNDIKAYTAYIPVYIKNGKTILSAAVLAYNTYVANLATAGFLPDMRLGHLTESFVDTTKLPGTITAGTPFALGSTTITPTDKGLYSPSASYTTGDIVSDTFTSKYICLVGPRISGVPYTITGTAPVETPGTSIYWKVIDNKSWSTLTYDASTDLQLEVTGFATNSLLWTSSNNPPNTAVQLDSNFLQGFTLFGTGITQRTMVTSFAYDFAGTTYSYKLNLGAATSTDSTKTFYVKNAASQLSTAVASKLTATLALYMNNAATNALAVLNSTTDAEATTNYNAIVNPGLATLASLYASNSTFMTYINVATTIANLCLSAANTQKQLLALRNNGTISASDYNAAKASNTTTFTNIQTRVTSAASSIAAQDATTANTNVALITAEQANVIADPNVKVYLLASDYSGSGAWNDRSGNGKNATVQVGSAIKSSAGNSIVLNGSTAWRFNDVNVGNAWTASVWYKQVGTNDANGMILTQSIAGNTRASIVMGKVNDVVNNRFNWFGFFNNSSNPTTAQLNSITLDTNVWVNLQLTWDGSNLKLYRDSVLVQEMAHSGVSASSGQYYVIGRREDNDQYVNGEIGEVRILSRTLGAADVTKTYMENLPTIMGLKAWYSAADYSGTGAWADKSGSGMSATILFGTAAKNSAGSAVVFDGATSWTFPNPAVGNAWSVSVWYKKYATATGNSVILSQTQTGANNIYISDTNGNNTIAAGFKAMSDNTSRQTSGTPITQELWTNIQTTWDGTTLRTYLNGVLNASATPGGTSADSGTAYILGSDFQGGQSNFINGEIAEVRIYNRALIQAEVTSIYSTTVGPVTGVRAWFTASEYSGSGAWLDKSGYGNNATADRGTITLNPDSNGISLDGATSMIFSNTNVGNAWSIVAWYRITGDIGSGASILTQVTYDTVNPNATLGYISGTNLSAGFANANTWTNGGTIPLVTNVWTNIHATWDGANIRSYINGILVSTVPSSATAVDNNLGYRIGASWNANTSLLGELGELRMYNRPLTQYEITDDYNSLVSSYNVPVTVPSSISNLAIWLDGTDPLATGTAPEVNATLATWKDKSTNSVTPTISGSSTGLVYAGAENAITWNGSSYLTMPNGSLPNGNSSFTYFFVVKTPNQNNTRLVNIGTSNQVGTQLGLQYRGIDMNFFQPDLLTTVPAANQINIIAITYNSTTTRRTIFYNSGSSRATNTLTPNWTSLNLPTTSQIIGANAGAGEVFYGNFYEVLVYSKALTPAERQGVEGYLAWKWGVQSTLPSTHPYRNSAPA